MKVLRRYHTKDAANFLGISKKTLFRYETRGAFPLAARNAINSWREYTDDDLKNLKRLRKIMRVNNSINKCVENKINYTSKENFFDAISRIALEMGFYAPLLEKDYYMTLILSRINELSKNLIFKGGTCLNKIYYSYYRLSENLHFSMYLPECAASRGSRYKRAQAVENNIEKFAKQFDMRVEGPKNAELNASRQVYFFVYDSAMVPREQKIKFEIEYKLNPVDKTEIRTVQHKFLHTFTGEPLLDGGKVNCLSLNEIVSEKLHTAVFSPAIALHDFYDLDFMLRDGFDLTNKEVIKLFKKKLEEDFPAGSADIDLRKYKVNLGRPDSEIENMLSRVETELFDILNPNERKNFDLNLALNRINKAVEKMFS